MKLDYTTVNGVSGLVDTGGGNSTWGITQDVSGVTDYVKEARENKSKKTHWRMMCSIPYVVAFEIKEKFGLDVFDEATMKDKVMVAKLKHILQWHYPDLLVQT